MACWTRWNCLREQFRDTILRVRNTALIAIPVAGILSGLALLHAYWALGGRWGSAYVVPVVRGQRSFEPSPFATWIVCGLLTVAVLLVMGKAGWLWPGAGPIVLNGGMWCLSLVFMLLSLIHI